MVVGLPVAITVSGYSAVGSPREFTPVIAVAHRRPDVVTVSVIVAVVLVMVVVVVVDGHWSVRSVRPRTVRVPCVVRIIPAPPVVESVVIPIGRIVVGTIIVARPPPVITHVNT